MCQVYAAGYAQRHPTWRSNPWTGCRQLAQATFGDATPTLARMLASNPRAVREHVRWTLALLPAGLQLALFNATWGNANPDYAPVEYPNSAFAALASLAASLIITAALVVALRSWRFGWARWFGERRGVGLAMLAVAVASVPVILIQRPRPSYLFALTVFLMAVIGSAVHVLTHRWPRWRDGVAVGACALAVLLVPPYFVRHPSERPLYTAYRVLRPLSTAIADPQGHVVLGDYAEELRAYTRLRGVRTAESYDVLQTRADGQGIVDFLDEKKIDIFFVQPRVLIAFRQIADAAALLSDPESFGWRSLTVVTRKGQAWILLYRAA